jgi:hypothetical protein
MGRDVTKIAIKMQLQQSIRPIGKLQRAVADAGQDPQHVDLEVRNTTINGPALEIFLSAQRSTISFCYPEEFGVLLIFRTEIVKLMGPDVTKVAVQKQIIQSI